MQRKTINLQLPWNFGTFASHPWRILWTGIFFWYWETVFYVATGRYFWVGALNTKIEKCIVVWEQVGLPTRVKLLGTPQLPQWFRLHQVIPIPCLPPSACVVSQCMHTVVVIVCSDDSSSLLCHLGMASHFLLLWRLADLSEMTLQRSQVTMVQWLYYLMGMINLVFQGGTEVGD